MDQWNNVSLVHESALRLNPVRGPNPYRGEYLGASFGCIVTSGAGTASHPIDEIQPDPKTYYLDFGINEYQQFGKSESIEVEITNITIAGGEFQADEFDCNSLMLPK